MGKSIVSGQAMRAATAWGNRDDDMVAARLLCRPMPSALGRITIDVSALDGPAATKTDATGAVQVDR